MFSKHLEASPCSATAKKDDMSKPSNYRPVSLLPCISKVFEKVVFNHVHHYLRQNSLLTPKQSGFTPGDSTINQLIHVCHKIYNAFDDGDEVQAVFLDFSKAFDSVWHEGLVYKLGTMGIRGKLLSWFTSYLSDRKQKVVVNGDISDAKLMECGVPQGSVLGPLLFLIYINDIVNDIKSDIYIFADDTSLFQTVKRDIRGATNVLNRDLNVINSWCIKWLIRINVLKTKGMLFSRKRNPTPHLPIYLNNQPVENVDTHKQLGMTLSKSLDWHVHIEDICGKASQRINAWKSLQYKLSRKHMESCINLFVYPILDYGDILYDNCRQVDKAELTGVHLAAARAIVGGKKRTSHDRLYTELGWQPLQYRRDTHKISKLYDIVHGHTPDYLKRNLPSLATGRGTRSATAEHFVLYRCKTEVYRNSFFPTVVKLYNNLDIQIKHIARRNSFKYTMKKRLKFSVPPQYYLGPRKYSIILCQMRLRFCDLLFYLHSKGCVESPLCACRGGNETLHHFFFDCHRFIIQRREFFETINNILVHNNIGLAWSVEIFISGSNDWNDNINTLVYNAVIKYIVDTNRFN